MQEINNISDYPLSPTDAALEGFKINDLILLKRTQPDMYEGQKMTGN